MSSILKDAFVNKLITMNEAETIWRNMLVHSRWLPADSFAEYLKFSDK